ncbi:MAG: NUDIX domain-containing protein [Dehalococcoidia bacterium]|nr:NUDIX domain-containing protein [Dehalococcoidia bacterium]
MSRTRDLPLGYARHMGPSPVVAAIVVIFAILDDGLQVLLVHRSAEPERDKWALPGGRWDGSESLEDSAQRKLLGETGASDLYLEQLFTTSNLDATSPSVAVAYFALVEDSSVRLRQDREWPPAWHRVDALPGLAFRNNEVIKQAVERVRAKLEYTNIAYGLLPEEFTLRELQTVYQAILGEALDRRNFRKRMLSAGLIEATGGHRREGAHRPALLYRFVRREPVFI